MCVVHTALLTASEQSAINKPALHKELASIWLNLSTFQQKLPVENLVVRASFTSEKLLIFCAACDSQINFYPCFSTRLRNISNMEGEMSNMESFFSPNEYGVGYKHLVHANIPQKVEIRPLQYYVFMFR